MRAGIVEPEALVACKESTPLLFIHALHLAWRTSVINLANIPQALDLGFRTIPDELYTDYLGILQ